MPIDFLPTAINAGGQVVGANHFEPGLWDHAMLWKDGKEQDLGTLPGGIISHANAINDRGQVVGVSTSQEVGDHTSTWVDHAFLWEDGKMRDLGLPRHGKGGEANSINNKGQVVGTSDIRYQKMEGKTLNYIAGPQAILWMNGNAYNLNDLITKETDWVLNQAFAINDRGQIVGLGYRTKDENGHLVRSLRVFFLTPR